LPGKRLSQGHTEDNGITGGFHNKMNRIQRQAYGFRNFENSRLRVTVSGFKKGSGLRSAHVLGEEPILCKLWMAERQGFEPWVHVLARTTV